MSIYIPTAHRVTSPSSHHTYTNHQSAIKSVPVSPYLTQDDKSSYSSYFPSCPKYSGPGMWFLLNITALNVNKDPTGEKYFIQMLRNLAHNHPCGDCRNHMKEYMAKHRPEDWQGRPNGLFQYMVEFHNAVNQRLGKPIMSYDQAYTMYTANLIDGVCTGGCDSSPSTGGLASTGFTSPIISTSSTVTDTTIPSIDYRYY